MPADGRPEMLALRRELALRSHEFPEWEKLSNSEQAFSGGEIVVLLAGLAATLVEFDKTLTATESILRRLRGLYGWVRGNAAQASEDSASLGEREKILVLLFDAYITERQPMSAERLASLGGMSAQRCTEHLAALKAMGLVTLAPGEAWFYRPA